MGVGFDTCVLKKKWFWLIDLGSWIRRTCLVNVSCSKYASAFLYVKICTNGLQLWLLIHSEFNAHDFMIISSRWWADPQRISHKRLWGWFFGWLVVDDLVFSWYTCVECGGMFNVEGRRQGGRKVRRAQLSFQIKFRGSIFHLWCHQSSSEHQKANTKKRTPNTQIKRFDAIPDTKFPKES